MKVFFVYAGRRGSNLECAIALHEIAKKLKLESELILSTDNSRAEKVRQLYPEASFYDFLSPFQMLALRKKLEGGISFFTMVSPKIMPLFLSLKSKKIIYFHATYDYSYSHKGPQDHAIDFLHQLAIQNSTMAVATQYPLAWQLRLRLGKEAEVLPHPPYSPIKKEFFAEEEKVGLPVRGYFLHFGGIERASKGTGLLLKATQGSQLPVVMAGKSDPPHTRGNIVHLNRWVTDGELHWLVKNCRCVVLPYLVSSQFSGCLALAFHFKKPVLAPFCASFEKWIDEGKTGWFFSQGDWGDLRSKMEGIHNGTLRYSAQAIEGKEIEMAKKTSSKLKLILQRLHRS